MTEPVTGDDLRKTAAASAELLRSVADLDWSTPVPGLDFTVSSVVAHMAQGSAWYAVDLSAGGPDLTVVEVKVAPELPAEIGPAVVETTASMLAAVIDASGPDHRGFHPWGQADAAGFAGMGCDELLVHTDDAARALGVDFTPDEALVARVLARLFPWVATDDPDAEDPWTLLRWANGRLDRPGRPHQDRWVWHCAPLAEWDGTNPNDRAS